MLIVLDTNVLVSGLLKPFGVCGTIVRMVTTFDISICYDTRIVSEYRDVLYRPKFSFNRNHVSILLDYLEHSGIAVAGLPLKLSLPDRDDDCFLETALAAKADYLVTGNIAHFPKHLRCGIAVVNSGEFLEKYREDLNNS
ncbi:MAG: putative toxin-antitoxin system toxin component, PIN family [Candidatus Aegiribacteria sp.]|nr:putative toxin-antitoxin system toxin component, PIN family [Candidatus Aegiribacteria sp.]